MGTDIDPFLVEQKEKNICKIISKYIDKEGNGFFCKIPFPTYVTPLPVLMTGYKQLAKEDLFIGNKIKLKINDNKEILITIDTERKTYVSEKFHIIIIEIKKEDNLDIDSFLDIITEYKPKEMIGKKIYSIYYGNPNKEIISGKINKIQTSKYKFEYSCKYKSEFKGSPIISKDNFKIIGINIGSYKESNLCKGVFFNQVILDFHFKFFSVIEPKKEIIQKRKINIIFRLMNGEDIIIKEIEEDMMFGELVTYFYINSKYCYSEYITFFYNGYINSYSTETLKNLNIKNNSYIYVQLNNKIFFSNSINIIIKYDGKFLCLLVGENMLIKEMLLVFSQKLRRPYKEIISKYTFIYGCKNLLNVLENTLKHFGLIDKSTIETI